MLRLIGSFGAFASQHGKFRFGDGPALLDRVGFDGWMLVAAQSLRMPAMRRDSAAASARICSTGDGDWDCGLAFGFVLMFETCVDRFEIVRGFCRRRFSGSSSSAWPAATRASVLSSAPRATKETSPSVDLRAM